MEKNRNPQQQNEHMPDPNEMMRNDKDVERENIGYGNAGEQKQTEAPTDNERKEPGQQSSTANASE